MNDLGATQVLDDATPNTTPRPLLDQAISSRDMQNYALLNNETTNQDLMATGTIAVNNVGLQLGDDDDSVRVLQAND